MKTSSHAIFSADRKYRYRLTRWWYDGGPILCFCLLNASNANENRNDPTVHRCIGFGHYWGYSGILGRWLCKDCRKIGGQEVD